MASKLLIIGVLAACLSCGLAQLSGSVSPNPAGGSDVSVTASKFGGKPDLNVGGGVLASSNTDANMPTVGAFAKLNIKDNSIGFTRTHTPGVSDSFSQNIRFNLLNNDKHRLDANLFNKDTKLNNGFQYNTRGESLDYTHRAGHGLSLGATHIPNFGTTAELSGKANLWSSRNRQSTFDLTGSASRSFGGPMAPKNNFGFGLGFTHIF